MSEWINCKERQPEKDGRYLVCENHYSQWIGISAFRQERWDFDVLYWMELPKKPTIDKE